MQLRPWRPSGLLTATRTVGEIRARMNGTALDLWIRVNGRPRWYAVEASELAEFLSGPDTEITLVAESDGNAEPPAAEFD